MMNKVRPNLIANWLFMVALLVFAIVVVGGITRLTESGLSITEWKPVSGTLPPLSDAAWAEAFAKYQQTPEFREINAGMSLSAFKFIFFWEWVHRVLGRLIGLALVLPLIWFWIRGVLPKTYGLRILAVAALVGLQGSIGWWMVASGLSERTDVSHFRLAIHLLTALTILAGLVWTALDLKRLARNPGAKRARFSGYAAWVVLILDFQILYGAYVAGLNAGQVASSWPLMNGSFVPEGIDWSNGPLSAMFNDPYLIHFIHRWWAWVVVLMLILFARRVKAAGNRPASITIHSLFGTQILLGIATVMTGVNITVAVLHQAVGALLVAAVAWGLHGLCLQKEIQR
jgi:cytochrome c oxidase assembly protein subunit 15